MFSEEHADLYPIVDYFIHRKCSPTWSIAGDITPFIDVTYVVNGSANYQIGTKKIKVSTGDLLCIPKGTYRAATSVPDDLMESYPINFFLYNHLGREISLPFPLVSNIGHRPDIIALFKDLNAEWIGRTPGYELKVRAYLLLILQRYFELIVYNNDTGLIDGRIKKTIRYVASHYAEALTIQQMAELVDLNPVYFGYLFKQATGMNFRKYLTSIRLNHAEDMLRSGECNVNEAAVQCGYTDVFYFSKVYKENRGVSPSRVYHSKG